MIPKHRPPTHPGEILQQEFLRSAYDLRIPVSEAWLFKNTRALAMVRQG